MEDEDDCMHADDVGIRVDDEGRLGGDNDAMYVCACAGDEDGWMYPDDVCLYADDVDEDG